MSFFSFYKSRVNNKLEGLGLLALRLWLAQEFVTAGLTKLDAGWQAPSWFGTLSFPLPVSWLPDDINWVVAALGEIALGLALALGLFSRLAAVGLLFITWVAVYSVHFDLGWAGWNQIETDVGLGFKVPLMLAIMLLAVLTQGGGRFALDAGLVRLPDIAPEPESECPKIPT